MGGVTKTISNIVKNPVRLGADVMTFGTNELARKVPAIGNAEDMVNQSLFGSRQNPNTPQMGQMSPLQILQNSGGAPLLSNIALGVNPNDALASYFGVDPKDYGTWKAQLSPSEQEAIGGLENSLNQISTNTEMKTQAVQKLVNDFPDYMASAIPKYTGIMDQQTQAAAQAALDKVSAKYAAGGSLSSGAMAAASARTAAETEQDNLKMGTDLANQDWMKKFNEANGLLSFQQKMLGQGATAGASFLQKALEMNQSADATNVTNATNAANASKSKNDAFMGALGGFAGSVFGPVGSAIGSNIAKNFTSSSSNTDTKKANYDDSVI